jgi:Domain of unknown function (DUF222)/HNH endonuclease
MSEQVNGGEAAQLGAAAAALTTLAAAGLAADAASDVAVLLEVIEQAELALCRRVERVDRSGEFAADGSPSTASWLRGQANCSDGLAVRRVRIGRALMDRLPCTARAWAAGQCTVEHADVIARVVRGLDEVKTSVLDRELAIAAATVSPIELSRLAARFKHEIDPQDAEQRARRARSEQKLHCSQTFEGRWVLSATFDAEAGAIVKAALDAFTPLPRPVIDGELPESVAQRRAEALTEICRQALEHGQGRGTGGEKPTLIVTVDDEAMRDGIGYGTLPDGTPIPSAAVRRLACDARIIPVLYGTKSCPLDIGRSSRVIPPAMRKALVLRDKGCRFPGCGRPASWTDGHHVIHWRDGGPTALWNLLLLCRFHHHRVHEGGWTIRPLGEGDFRFEPPDPLAPIPPPGQRRYGRAA